MTVKATMMAFVMGPVAGLIGCGNYGSCDPPYGKEVIPTGVEVSPDGRYAFVAATWFYRKDSCASGRVGGAIHVVDLLSSEEPVTLDGLPASTGSAAITSESFISLRGSFAAPLDLDADYFSVPIAPPFAVERVELPVDALAVQATAGNAAFLLINDRVLIRSGASPDVIIPVPQGASGIARGNRRVYVSSLSGEVSEIDPFVGEEVRRIPSCPSHGPIAVLGTGLILSTCQTGGIAAIDPSTSAIAVAATNDYFTAVAASPNAARAIVSIPDPQGTDDSRVFDPTLGLVGELIFGGLGDAGVFFSDRAYVVTANTPRIVDLATGEASQIPGILYSSFFSQVANLPPDRVIVVRSRAYELELHVIDSMTGAATQDPVLLPPPRDMPLR